MTDKKDDIVEFLSRYPPPVQEVAACTRDKIRAAMPDATEILDLSAGIVGYGFGSGYRDLICTLIPSRSGVKLGIVRGADLPDPSGLMAGAGKSHRYVALNGRADVTRPELGRLLDAAIGAWKERRNQRVR